MFKIVLIHNLLLKMFVSRIVQKLLKMRYFMSLFCDC